MDLPGHTFFQIDARLRGDLFSMTYEGARCGIWPHRAANFRGELRKSPARLLSKRDTSPSTSFGPF
jgi:hypothetical protein